MHLWNYCESWSEFSEPNMGNVDAIDADAAIGTLNDPKEWQSQGRLSSSCATHYTNLLHWFHRECDACEHCKKGSMSLKKKKHLVNRHLTHGHLTKISLPTKVWQLYPCQILYTISWPNACQLNDCWQKVVKQ